LEAYIPTSTATVATANQPDIDDSLPIPSDILMLFDEPPLLREDDGLYDTVVEKFAELVASNDDAEDFEAPRPPDLSAEVSEVLDPPFHDMSTNARRSTTHEVRYNREMSATFHDHSEDGKYRLAPRPDSEKD
jgi:hypothetical protein